MDILPTFCRLAGAQLPERPIDGHDIRDLLFAQPNAKSPYKVFYYYRRRQLQAVRMGEYKYHLPLKRTYPNWTSPDKAGSGRSGKLVRVDDEPTGEDLSEKFPGLVTRFVEQAKRAESVLGNEDRPGSQQRPPSTLSSARPMVLSDKDSNKPGK